jgi:hypothetical protein
MNLGEFRKLASLSGLMGLLQSVSRGTATDAGTLTGAETVPVSRGVGLLQTTTQKIAALAGSGALYAANMTALRALSVNGLADGTPVTLAGYNAIGDGGGGKFVWSSTSSRADDTGCTIKPNSVAGNGRWLRIIQEQDARINVLWFGADRTATSSTSGNDSSAAISSALTVCKTFKNAGTGTPPATSILKLYFPAGGYRFNGLALGYADAEICGDQMGTVRLYHNNGFHEPAIYIYGGGYVTAAPYGGCHDIRVNAGDSTTGAIVYIDTTVDQGFNMDGLWCVGSTTTPAGLDGLSFHDYLNAGSRKNRFDSISGYAVVARAFKAREQLCSTSTGYRFPSSAINIATGAITPNGNQGPLEPGAAVMWFTTGASPTATDTGQPLATGDQGVCYFAAKGSSATTIFLTRARSDALAGTNILTFTAQGSGTNGLVVFRANFDVSIQNATNIVYNNDKGVIIATSVVDGGVSGAATLATGFLTSIKTDNGNSANRATHVVFVASSGTMPTNLLPGTAYYPRYIDGRTVELYPDPTSAAATGSTANRITPTGGSGNLTLLYGSVTSVLGMGHYVMDDFTWDNSSSAQTESINGVSCGGYGVFYADYANASSYKGGIEFKNARIEINKAMGRDPRSNCLVPNVFRIVGNLGAAPLDGPAVAFLANNLHLDLAVSINQRNIRFFGQMYGEMAYMLRNCSYFGISSVVQNDQYNMLGAIQGKNGLVRGRVLEATNSFIPSFLRMDNTAIVKVGGMHAATANDSANSILQVGDSLRNPTATGPFAYKSVSPGAGFYAGSNVTTSGLTATSTNGSNVFSISGSFPQSFCPGSVVSIATALDGVNPLQGVVGEIDNLSATKTFTLYSASTGLPLNAGATVSAQAVTYVAAAYAQVDAVQVYQLSVTFASAANSAVTEVDVTVAGASFGISGTNPTPVQFGWPTTLPAGVALMGFVKSSTQIGVRLTNLSGSAYSGTINFSARVPQ